MRWIVLGAQNENIQLVSKNPHDNEQPGLLPKGSFLTIENEKTNTKHILRVDQTIQTQPYKPSPLIVDMDLSGLYEDTKCQNIISAFRSRDLSNREDGLVDYIYPQLVARRSTQDEIDLALGQTSALKGPRVFIATVHSGQNYLLVDDENHYIITTLPISMFFHQMIICGSTGSGKTVAMKYLAQYFVEEFEGAVLAVNVKDTDFLKMDKPSVTSNCNIHKEWSVLNTSPKGIPNTTIYIPATEMIPRGVNENICTRVTLSVDDIDPESLIGLMRNISDIGAQYLPDIFRHWKEREKKDDETFKDFVTYFQRAEGDRYFECLNKTGTRYDRTLFSSTFQNVLNNLISAMQMFDHNDADVLSEEDILEPGKLSVINVATSPTAVTFGSVLLRDLLRRIVIAKSQGDSSVPILIIIDEVHQFYNSEDSKEALGYLDTICRTGRSQEIGVIFSSQNPSDIPKGLSSVVNSKIFFKSADTPPLKSSGITSDEMANLKKGFAVVNIHDMPQIKVIKFPLSYSGVFENE